MRSQRLCSVRALWFGLLIGVSVVVCQTPASAQQTVKDDDSYGKGGKSYTFEVDRKNDTFTSIEYRDSKYRKREARATSVSKKTGKKLYDNLYLYDCNEKLTYSREIKYDDEGKEILFEEKSFENGKQIAGYRNGVYEDPDYEGSVQKRFRSFEEKFDPETGKYKKFFLFDERTPKSEIGIPERDTSTCPVNALPPNEILGAFSLIREDSDPEGFNTYGLDARYTRALSEDVGVTANVNLHFQERGGVDLRKLSVLGGVTFWLFDGAKRDDRVTFSTHALAGWSNLNSSVGPVSATANSFTMKLGGRMDINVTNGFFVSPIGIYYSPTFFGNSTQHNVHYSGGFGFRFGGRGNVGGHLKEGLSARDVDGPPGKDGNPIPYRTCGGQCSTPVTDPSGTFCGQQRACSENKGCECHMYDSKGEDDQSKWKHVWKPGDPKRVENPDFRCLCVKPK